MDGGLAGDGFSYGGLERGKRRGKMVPSTGVCSEDSSIYGQNKLLRLRGIFYRSSKHSTRTVMVKPNGNMLVKL